ncbi:MAG: hypothetical protein VX228_14790, partial [Pseudomonadota bacterium]|nr:hypothetical protein [Pseudomonadota bacterium]
RPISRDGEAGEGCRGEARRLEDQSRNNCRKETGQSSSSDCGGGVELGIANQSTDGMTQLNANYAFTKVGNIEQQRITLSLEMQF